MVAAFPHPEGPRVMVRDGAAYIDGLIETDPDVVAAVAAADNPVAAVQERLCLGARVLRIAGASLDVNLIHSEVDKLTDNFAGTVTSAVERIAATSAQLLDGEEGALPAVLKTFRTEVEELLENAFDPDSRKSVLSRIETAFLKAAEDQLRAVRRMVDPESEESPLRRWRGDIIAQGQQQAKTVTDAIRDLADKVIVQQAAARATTEALEKSSTKGFSFEDLLHSVIEPCAITHGDLAEQTGREVGAQGTLKGDEVVTLNRDDTRGQPARFAFEVKATKLSLKKTFEELDAAMANREAAVAIATFSSQANAPSTAPFVYYDNKAILVIDKDDPDPTALRLAYAWARWMTRRQLNEESGRPNADRIDALLEDARRELTRMSTIKRAHSTAANKIAEAGREASAMTSGVNAILDTIAAEIASDAGESALAG